MSGLFTAPTLQSQKAPSKAILLEEGGYPARVARIIDLGLQPGSEQYPEPKLKMIVTFELLDEFMTETNEDGIPVMIQDPEGDPGEMIPKPLLDKPRWFDFEFTYNSDGYMGENSHLYKFMRAVDAFEVAPNLEQGIEGHPAKNLVDILGYPLTVGIIRKTPTKGKNAGVPKNQVSTFSPMKSKERREAKELVNPTVFFNMGEPDLAVFNNLPGGESPYAIKNRITSGPAFKESKLFVLLGGTPEAKAPVTNAATDDQVDEALKAELEAQRLAREEAAAQAKAAGESGKQPVSPF